MFSLLDICILHFYVWKWCIWDRYHVWSIFWLFYIQYSAFSCITPNMRAWYKLCKIYPEDEAWQSSGAWLDNSGPGHTFLSVSSMSSWTQVDEIFITNAAPFSLSCLSSSIGPNVLSSSVLASMYNVHPYTKQTRI